MFSAFQWTHSHFFYVKQAWNQTVISKNYFSFTFAGISVPANLVCGVHQV